MNKCSNCGKELPDNELYSYVDENNEAITKHSKDYCWRCYNEKYPNDKIGIDEVLRKRGYKVQISTDELKKGIYVEDRFHRAKPGLGDELIKEYDL